MPGHARQDQDRRLHLGQAQRPQHFVAGHVGEVQVEQDDVVVVELAEIDALFAEIGRVDVEALRFQHQFDALCGRLSSSISRTRISFPFAAARRDAG